MVWITVPFLILFDRTKNRILLRDGGEKVKEEIAFITDCIRIKSLFSLIRDFRLRDRLSKETSYTPGKIHSHLGRGNYRGNSQTAYIVHT